MKKIMIFTMLLIILIPAFTQEEGTYNRFRHSREEYIAVGRDLGKSNNMDIDCNDEEVRADINESKSIFYSDTSSVEEKSDALWNLGHIKCQEVIDFYEDIIKNNPNQKMRKDALLYLGWLRATSGIPFLLEVAKKENNLFFVIEIAATLCVMEEFELAALILDKVCFDGKGKVKEECIGAYAFAGRNELVKNYFLSEWEKDNDEETKFRIALILTKYGIYDITFPIIKETLINSTHTYKRHSAISGLAAIATEEAIELIQNCINDNDIVVANYAKFVMLCLKEGRRYK
jgi:HEAT repeat protein